MEYFILYCYVGLIYEIYLYGEGSEFKTFFMLEPFRYKCIITVIITIAYPAIALIRFINKI